MESFTKFSKQILESGDIDPDYHFMRVYSKHMNMDHSEKLNWILLKTVVYRTASELEIMLKGKRFDQVKYGNERNKAKNRAEEYYHHASNFFRFVSVDQVCESFTAFSWLSMVKGYGPWARWKLLDLFDCVLDKKVRAFEHVDFRHAYEFPLKGLLLINDMEEDVKLLSNNKLYEKLLKNAWRQMPKVSVTPHNFNKGIRVNELETCLCKYHSYVHGHYYPGKDLEHLRKDLEPFKLKLVWSL